MSVKILKDQGQGRTFIFLQEVGKYHGFALQSAELLGARVRTITLECAVITPTNWLELATQVLALLQEQKIRQCAFIGFGAAGALVQHLVLTVPKMVRSITLVDATFRPHATFLQRIVDWFERILPLGLPLRLKSSDFDAKPFAQRIRCPALIVLSEVASPFLRDQAYAIAQRIPSAWVVSLAGDTNDVDEFCNLLSEFESVPVKCPQKNRAEISQVLSQV
jgi:pimeloyl-ACP methyl ester carboxylesterase